MGSCRPRVRVLGPCVSAAEQIAPWAPSPDPVPVEDNKRRPASDYFKQSSGDGLWNTPSQDSAPGFRSTYY